MSPGAAGDSGTGLGIQTGPPSDCEPYRAIIQEKLDQGLSGQRIYQDLAMEGAGGGGPSYDSVKRFLRQQRKTSPVPFRRMEAPPGQEMQVDFGTGAPVVGADGQRRRTYVFRIVLSCSRKAYSEVVYRQTTEDFIACLENAFQHFGGYTRTIVIDNLRAAVKQPDWYDPELNPRLEAFCRHYDTVILPTIANLVIRPPTYERYRRAIRHSVAVVAWGKVERQGQVVHVLVDRASNLSDVVNANPPKTAARNFR